MMEELLAYNKTFVAEKRYEQYRESSIKDYEEYSAMSDEDKKK